MARPDSSRTNRQGYSRKSFHFIAYLSTAFPGMNGAGRTGFSPLSPPFQRFYRLSNSLRASQSGAPAQSQRNLWKSKSSSVHFLTIRFVFSTGKGVSPAAKYSMSATFTATSWLSFPAGTITKSSTSMVSSSVK